MSKSSSGSSSSMSSAESGSYRIAPEDWETCPSNSPARKSVEMTPLTGNDTAYLCGRRAMGHWHEIVVVRV